MFVRIAVTVVLMTRLALAAADPIRIDAPEGARWVAVDPTLNEFPADATHLRLVRGGLDKQAAVLPLIGKVKIDVVDLEMNPRYTPVLMGGGPQPAPAGDVNSYRQTPWRAPNFMITVTDARSPGIRIKRVVVSM